MSESREISYKIDWASVDKLGRTKVEKSADWITSLKGVLRSTFCTEKAPAPQLAMLKLMLPAPTTQWELPRMVLTWGKTFLQTWELKSERNRLRHHIQWMTLFRSHKLAPEKLTNNISPRKFGMQISCPSFMDWQMLSQAIQWCLCSPLESHNQLAITLFILEIPGRPHCQGMYRNRGKDWF